MQFKLIILSLCISTSCFGRAASFSNFSNTFAKQIKKEASYIRNNHASFSPSPIDVIYYRCTWEVDPAIRYIKGEVTAYFLFSKASKEISFDLRDVLSVDSILQRNNKLPFERKNDSVFIQFSQIQDVGKLDSLTIFYQGVPANSGYGSFSNDLVSGKPVMWTMSEPFGGRDWWPCKNGLDDKADSMDIYITAPAKYTSVSNGVRQSVTISGDLKTTHWKHRYPIASYLVCLAVAEYEEFETTFQIGNGNLLMQTFSYPGSLELFKEKTPLVLGSMKYFTELLGPYPFMKEKYGHTQMGRSGGMEHQTNTFLSTPEESLMAHELAHQWFGNTITAGSWHHIWLSEGFATMLASMDLEKKYPLTSRETRKKEIGNITSIPNGSVFVPDITSVPRIFDSRLTYSKASRVLNMLRFILGDSLFFKGVHNYLSDETLRYGFATTEDLQRNIEKASGKDLGYFFRDWVYGQGYPTYQVRWSQVGSEYADIRINQFTSDHSVSFFALPIPLVFKNSTQQKTIILNNTYNGETFFEKIGFVADTVLIDPDYWLITKNNVAEKITTNSDPKNEVMVYPNPVSSSFYIYLKNNEAKTASIKIFDGTGKVLLEDRMDFAGMAAYKEFNIDKFPVGTYFIHVRTDKNLKAIKKIVKH